MESAAKPDEPTPAEANNAAATFQNSSNLINPVEAFPAEPPTVTPTSQSDSPLPIELHPPEEQAPYSLDLAESEATLAKPSVVRQNPASSSQQVRIAPGVRSQEVGAVIHQQQRRQRRQVLLWSFGLILFATASFYGVFRLRESIQLTTHLTDIDRRGGQVTWRLSERGQSGQQWLPASWQWLWQHFQVIDRVELQQAHDRDLQDLKSFSTLRELSVHSDGNVSDVGLQILGQIAGTKAISLSGPDVTDIGLNALANLKQVEKLEITSCRKLTAKGLQIIGQFPLQQLRLVHPQLEPVVLEAIGSLTELRTLHLGAEQFPPGALGYLAPLTQLTTLSIQGRLRDTDLESLPTLPNLEKLILEDTLIHGTTFSNLEKLPTLRELMLSSTAVDDRTLANIPALPTLTHLYLDDTLISDTGIQQLSHLPALELLSIRNTVISDLALAELVDLLPTLKTIEPRGRSDSF